MSKAEYLAQKEEQEEVKDTIDQSLISKTTDSITMQTTVHYEGFRVFDDFIMSAAYTLDEFDSYGEQLLTPKVGTFEITMHIKHKGARKPKKVVLVTDGKMHMLEPNFIYGEKLGDFMLLFYYDVLKTRTVPRDIINAKSIQVKVRYDNGDVVYDATEDDRKAVETIFKSFIQDGGRDYSSDGESEN
jgi:hypothetical protein